MTTRTTHRRLVVGIIAIGLAATACSSSKNGTKSSAANTTSAGSSTSAPASSSAAASSTAAAAGTGACKYVTTEQASQLAGSPVKAGVERSLNSGPITFKYCDYIFDPGNAPGVSIAIADLSAGGTALYQAFRADKQSDSDFEDVPGVGDAAFYASENLNVLKGSTGVILYVGRANGSPRGRDGIPDEKKLADIVLPQL